MTRERYAIAAAAIVVVIMTIAFVAIPYYNAYELSTPPVIQNSPSSNAPLSQPTDSNAFPPPPEAHNVTVLGVLKTSQMNPACALNSPPCAISPASIYYVVVNGRNYRLIFADNIVIPNNVSGSNVIITGAYITPSTFNAGQWTPSLNFYGDIYVYKVTFFYTLPS